MIISILLETIDNNRLTKELEKTTVLASNWVKKGKGFPLQA
jgi:hypothetical protein